MKKDFRSKVTGKGKKPFVFGTHGTRTRAGKIFLNGGVIATLIDCHCMGTAMAPAYQQEGRGLDTFPVYRYATGTLNIKYLKPTPNDQPIEIRAVVKEIKGKKVVMDCRMLSHGTLTAQAEVIAIRVVDTFEKDQSNPLLHPDYLKLRIGMLEAINIYKSTERLKCSRESI